MSFIGNLENVALKKQEDICAYLVYIGTDFIMRVYNGKDLVGIYDFGEYTNPRGYLRCKDCFYIDKVFKWEECMETYLIYKKMYNYYMVSEIGELGTLGMVDIPCPDRPNALLMYQTYNKYTKSKLYYQLDEKLETVHIYGSVNSN